MTFFQGSKIGIDSFRRAINKQQVLNKNYLKLKILSTKYCVVDVVLATKKLISGTLEFGYLALSFGVIVLLVLTKLFVSYKQFKKDTNVVS